MSRATRGAEQNKVYTKDLDGDKSRHGMNGDKSTTSRATRGCKETKATKKE